jgi:hypothetical protein
MLVTLSLHLLARYHVVLSDDAVNEIADQAVLIIGSLGIVGTKIIDAKQAAIACPPQKES